MRKALQRRLDSPRTIYVAAAVTLALGLFFTFVWAPHPWGWKGIDSYHDLARSLARGESFPTMKVPWGYSYFVAACYGLFGERPWVPPFIQVILNASVPVMLYHLVRPAVGQRPASLAALLVGAFSFNTVYASTQSSDAICTVLFLGSLLCFARGVQASSTGYFVASGVLSGIVPQFRPNMLLLPLALGALYLVLRPRSWRKAGRVAIYLGLVGLVQVPWIVRNYTLTGDFLPTSTHGGAQLWYGTLQVGPYLESRAHNPRSIFESAAFDYTSLLDRSVVISADYISCLPRDERVEMVYWTDHDPRPTHVLPRNHRGPTLDFEIPGFKVPTVVYYFFDASWPASGGQPAARSTMPLEGAANPYVAFVSDDHLGDLDRHGDVLDIFDVARMIRHIAWAEPLPYAENDLAVAVARLLPETARGGRNTPFDRLDVTESNATLRLTDGSTLTMPRRFAGRQTDLGVEAELAGSLVARTRTYTAMAAAPPPPGSCLFVERVRLNDVFYRSEPHIQRRYFALALDNISRDPAAFFAASLYRMPRLFIIRGTDDKATTQQFTSSRLAYGAGLALSAGYFALFVAGVVVAWRRRSPLLVALLPIAYVPLTIAFVLTNMRYTITVQPLMFAFMALAIVAALRLDWGRGGRGGGQRGALTRATP